jgi:transposase
VGIHPVKEGPLQPRGFDPNEDGGTRRMMTQEEYMDLKAMKRQGMTNVEIADATGYHPATVSRWLKNGGPPPARTGTTPPAVDERFANRIAELLRAAPKLLATSVYKIITAEGYTGSYSSVVRHLHSLRGPRFRSAEVASVRIETAPGEESQFDFSDVSEFTERWGLGKGSCFSNILCWSRFRFWWFASSEDREHTFEALVRSFEAFGGVPHVARTDRMGALGSSQGHRFKLHGPARAFFSHHGVELKACRARDAKRKGKVERPYRDLKESFLTELDALGPPSSVWELNVKAACFLAEVHARKHRTTGESPAVRLEAERQLLGPLPRSRFDTAYAEPRRVHVAVPRIEWNGVYYSVPTNCLGQKVEVRQEVDSQYIEICWAGSTVARHRIAQGEVKEVWDAAHWQAAQSQALGRGHRHLQLLLPSAEPERQPMLLDIEGDVAVAPVDLSSYGEEVTR